MLDGCVPWPAALAERYRRAGHWRGERLGDLLRVPSADAHRIAVVTARGRTTYGELDRRADRLAAGLLGLGVRPLDRVVVLLPNGPDFVALSVALYRLGALPVYALPAHRRSEVEHLARLSEAVALVVPERHQGFDFRAMAAEVAAAVPSLRHVLVAGGGGPALTLDDIEADPVELVAPAPDEVAFFLLSGGTTGVPKLIPRTHDDYAYQLRCSAAAVGAGADTVYLAALPVAHNAALGCPGALGTLRLGGRVVMADSPSPDHVFALIREEAVTLTTVMPTFLWLWSEAARLDGTRLDGVVVEVGGAKLDPQLARDAQAALGCTLTHWFGMAEGVLCCTRPGDPLEVAATTQGRPICPDDELRVVDEADAPVAAGGEGELLVRGPMTLRGYFRAPEHNREAFTADGFLRTGDVVRFDERDNLVVTGRIKDIVNRGGEKVATVEVEDALRSHPAVRDAAVVALPDAVLGELACACVVVAEDAPPPSLGELRAYLASLQMADFKLPDRIAVVGELERTSLGKVDKRRLRAAVLYGVAA